MISKEKDLQHISKAIPVILLAMAAPPSAFAADLDEKTQNDLIQIARLCRVLLEASLEKPREYEMGETHRALEFVKQTLERVEDQK